MALQVEAVPGASLYLDLVKRCLLDTVHDHQGGVQDVPRQRIEPGLLALLDRRGWRVVLPRPPEAVAEGRDWPAVAHTMIGAKRLDNLQACVEDVLRRGVPGDLIETGAWRGGATILMRAVLKAYGVTDRCVWVADSFRGLPPPDPERYPHDTGIDLRSHRVLAVSLDEVRTNFERYGLLDDQVRFLAGWFQDTLPSAPIERLAVLRLDGDLYASTIEALTHLYPKLSAGGYVIVDDYGIIQACRAAVHDYRDRHGIRDEIVPIDWSGVYWRRSAPGG